jgi:histidinol-phosphate aminotransferase
MERNETRRPGLDFVRPQVRRIAAYQPGEQPRTSGYVKLNTNENPYPPSPCVLETLRAGATEDLRLYPDPMANALRDKAAAVYGFEPEQVLAGNGSDDLLAMIVRTCIGVGERIVYPYPTYSLYDTLVSIADGHAVHVPFPSDFALPAGLAAAAGRATIVCNPNSPSGTQVPTPVLRALSREVRGLLVIDEAYVDFADESALQLARECDNVLVLRTFSKSFSLAGLRIGLAFGPAPVIAELAKVKDSYNLNRLSILAGVAALEDYGWMEANVRRVRQSRGRLSDGLRRLGYEVLPSQANFVLARSPGRSLRPVYEALKARRILVRHFPVPELDDALRITVGTDAEVDALVQALGEQPAGQALHRNSRNKVPLPPGEVR